MKWESADAPDTKQGLDLKTTHVQVLIRQAFELLIALASGKRSPTSQCYAMSVGLILHRVCMELL
ncbi:MAG: hypothetical protein F6J94_17800 [Moorea sp. SIO1F2]|uniref:hypothetical protein n=1 Tax=unclassified Moorena TaxID=2683338 RepID=UPI0013B5F666|nr:MULTISPECIES: hypothetical protein [unclassified Moorena]NEO00866.1 hypothetical protein [Moorena sp. SIO3I7]NEO04470.1 hypothetical protein [Moorena sp. SIO3I8]NEP22302.1 hypothetical protein [Moorena sp. SIO3I6]NEQ58103.1 hypothetical protein [Moorena sp. SIO4A1]NET83704.1 hypothetical protein [Moorena sp. SIO1F2]